MISEVDILVQKTWISAVPPKIGIPEYNTLRNIDDSVVQLLQPHL